MIIVAERNKAVTFEVPVNSTMEIKDYWVQSYQMTYKGVR